MKNILKTIAAIAGVVLIISACDDYSKINAPTLDVGSANFSKYVAIGNSLTAGYQSGSLYESAQNYSYGKLIADMMSTTFEQPLVSDPGTGGRLEIHSIDFATSDIVIVPNPGVGLPTNLNYPAPYNNLGVPGAFLYDVLAATDQNNCYTALGGTPNPMFDLILRNSALNLGSQFQQAAVLDPTFITLWIGNNDVLGFATSGGTKPAAPTDVTTIFGPLYNATAAQIATLGAQVVVANIPDVSTIPFFTTVGPKMAQEIPWYLLALSSVPGVFYQAHGNTGPSLTAYADSISLLTGTVLITLKGSSYAGLIGQPSGKFYKDFGYPGLPAGIDTTQPFGVHPQNPWPDALVLDPDEIATAVNTVDAYNGIIQDAANQFGFGLVDINTFFTTIRDHDLPLDGPGTVYNGISFKTFFITGGLFSLDGVHPTSQGQAIIANKFIEVINTKFNASIPKIDVSTIPGSLNFAAKLKYDEHGYVIFSKDAFDHLLF